MAQKSLDQPGDPSRQGNVGASKEQSGEPTLTCVEINGKSEDHKEWCGFPSPDENRYSERKPTAGSKMIGYLSTKSSARKKTPRRNMSL